jgi:hypothetical protein
MNRNRLNERADIESALEMAVERGEVVANYRERTGHNGGTGDKASFGALKHAENKMQFESVIRRLQLAYDQHGVGSNLFNGTLHEYLRLLNATWYQNSHALSEHREDLATDLFIKMIDPANSGSGASIFSFKGVRDDDGQPAPVHRFVNAVFKMFFMEKERTQRDFDFKHFRLVDDSASTSSGGDIRAGQLDKLAMPTPEEAKLERECEDSEQKRAADLRSFGRVGQQFGDAFTSKSDVHMAVVALLRKNADMSAKDIVQAMKTDRFNVYNGAGELIKVIQPMVVHERKVQRIKAAFFEGLRDIAKKNFDTSDPQVLADKVYRSMMARAGKPVRRHPVETKKSRSEAQRADPNYVEKTFSNDGPRFGGSRKRTNMDSDVDKDAGSNIS